jgi:hypothetical protein
MPLPLRPVVDLDKYAKLEKMLPITYPRPPVPEEDRRWIELMAKLDGIKRGLTAYV